MELVKPNSLGDTLDAINEITFTTGKIPQADRRKAAAWIAGRQGLEGAYGGTFAPTPADYRKGVRLFCGETVTSRAGTGHILAEEAFRALIVLDAPLASVKKALERATESMERQLQAWASHQMARPGYYCCATCSCALWRHLAAGGLSRQEERLTDAMKVLRSRRTGDGQWQGFPFYYALLALTEIDLPGAMDELEYAAPRCQRLSARTGGKGKYARRRRMLVADALARV